MREKRMRIFYACECGLWLRAFTISKIALNSISSQSQLSILIEFIMIYVEILLENTLFRVWIYFPITMRASESYGHRSAENSSTMILRLETCRYYAINSWQENSLRFPWARECVVEDFLSTLGRQSWHKNNFIVMTSNLGISFSPLSKLLPINSFLQQIPSLPAAPWYTHPATRLSLPRARVSSFSCSTV